MATRHIHSQRHHLEMTVTANNSRWNQFKALLKANRSSGFLPPKEFGPISMAVMFFSFVVGLIFLLCIFLGHYLKNDMLIIVSMIGAGVSIFTGLIAFSIRVILTMLKIFRK